MRRAISELPKPDSHVTHQANREIDRRRSRKEAYRRADDLAGRLAQEAANGFPVSFQQD